MPVVVKLHGPAFYDLEANELKIAREGRALRIMPYLISPSARTLDETSRRYGLSRRLTAIIRNPIPSVADTDVWKLQDCEVKTILFVGRFDWTKGGDVILQAFQKLLQYDKAAKLVFVGSDGTIPTHDGVLLNFDAYAQSLFAVQQRQCIEYNGRLAPSQIPALRRRAMLTVLTSRRDNQPNALLEAMALGCPVVAIEAGGIGELIEHDVTGLLARPDDLDDFCANIRRLLDNPEHAAKLGRRGREAALVRHNPRTVAEQTLEIYRQAIASRK